MRLHGKFVNFLRDTGANANLISIHDVDADKLQVMPHPPAGVLTMWNGAAQKTRGHVTRVFRLLVAWQHHGRSSAGQPRKTVSGGSGR